jgi:hypothetical protein
MERSICLASDLALEFSYAAPLSVASFMVRFRAAIALSFRFRTSIDKWPHSKRPIIGIPVLVTLK